VTIWIDNDEIEPWEKGSPTLCLKGSRFKVGDVLPKHRVGDRRFAPVDPRLTEMPLIILHDKGNDGFDTITSYTYMLMTDSLKKFPMT
jgi:hypothetical protein